MPRFATLDIGTNSVLLLVAERTPEGRFTAICQRAEITRLGRGVDATGRLSPEGMEDTLRTLALFSTEARALGVDGIAVTATSAARDAANGPEFMQAAKDRAGLTVEIISGDEEAELAFAAVGDEWRERIGDGGLVVIDIGGGSTEVIYGGVGAGRNGEVQVHFRKSFNVGSVRLTERFVKHDPPGAGELHQMSALLRQTLGELPPPPPHATVVGVAGTVTSLFAIENGIEPYDEKRIAGGVLELHALEGLRKQLTTLTLAQRRALPGLQPKRADVIPAGAMILEHALKTLGATRCGVSDRGVRWGLLSQRFGSR